MSTIAIDVDPYKTKPELEQLRELEADRSLRLLVVGDFSGQSTSKVVRVDRDNFDQILSDFAPKVEVAFGNGQFGDTELVFHSLADFEPDSLYLKSELFAPLRDNTGQTLYSEPEEEGHSAQLKPTPEQMAKLTSPGGLLDAILEKGSAGTNGGGAGATPNPKKVDNLEAMVQRIVAPYATKPESAESQRAAGERTKTLSLLLTHILHDEGFQALEAAWRGLDMLVHGLDTDSLIHLYILDISKEKLTADLKGTADVQDSDVYEALPGRWGLIAANLSFDREVVADVEALERISVLAQALGSPLIAEWLTSREENPKAEAAWQALRRSAAAHYIALALPRFLLRLPYGKDTVPVDGFEFEEMKGEPAHREYLWGNPAFACALALGRLYEQQNSLTPIPAYLKLGDLPMHIVELAGTKQARPCTEVLLSDNDCQSLLDEGVLPVAAVKGTDSVMFPRIRSIAQGAGELAGLE
jgi:type VI secretion system protein ImpC